MIGIIVIILLVISALLLIGVIMLQDEQGEGLGGIFGGGSGSAFGSRAGNVLTRITTILAAIFLLCTFLVAMINRSPDQDSTIDTARQERIESSDDAGWYTDITDIKDAEGVIPDSQIMDINNVEPGVGTPEETTPVTE